MHCTRTHTHTFRIRYNFCWDYIGTLIRNDMNFEFVYCTQRDANECTNVEFMSQFWHKNDLILAVRICHFWSTLNSPQNHEILCGHFFHQFVRDLIECSSSTIRYDDLMFWNIFVTTRTGTRLSFIQPLILTTGQSS